MTQNYTPFPDLVDEIKDLCADRVTGTLSIATQKNRSAQMILENGEIVFVYFSNKLGKEALKLMLDIKAGRYRFQQGGATRRISLPSTEAILNFLSNGGKTQKEKETKPSENQGVFSTEQKNVLESCLAEFIGPMAGIICEDLFDTVTTLRDGIDALAAEIPSADKAQQFKEMVVDQLA